jgi:hypothetical protein
MAFSLIKEKTGSTPYVLIDGAKRYMNIRGESYHENIIEFFAEINDWLDDGFPSVCDGFKVDIEMSYFNSSTAKIIFDMLSIMEDNAENGNDITVNWLVNGDNEIIVECGEDFAEELEHVKFNIVTL